MQHYTYKHVLTQFVLTLPIFNNRQKIGVETKIHHLHIWLMTAFVQMWNPLAEPWLTTEWAVYCCNWFKHISWNKLNQECNSVWNVYICKSYSKLYIYGNNMLEQSSSDKNWRVCNYNNAPLTNRPQGRRANVSSITDVHTPDFQIQYASLFE